MNKFKLGQTVVTRTINAAIAENIQFAKEIARALHRYTNCDWGEMDAGDKEVNDLAVKTGNDRIIAAYQTSMGKIWIITEWDRRCTTILFPHDD